MANRELEENNRLLREQNELLKRNRLISEETLDDSRDFANVLRDQAKQITFQVSEKKQLLSITNSINKIAQDSYNITEEELADLKATDNVLKQQKKLKKDLLGLESLKGKIIVEDEELQREINKSILNQINSSKILYKELDEQRIVAEKISQNMGVKTMDGIADITGAIPGLRKFSAPFQTAAKAARESAAGVELAARSGGKGLTREKIKQLGLEKQVGNLTGRAAAQKLRGMSGMSKGILAAKAGFKALGPIIRTALGPIGLIMLAVDAVKMIVDLFVTADKNTTQIAKNLGISKANAEGIRQEFVRIAASSSNILATSKALLEAQKDLVDFSGAVTLQSFKQADAQVLLTKNLGIAGNNAAQFQALLGASNNTLGDVIESTRVLTDEQFASNGFFISNQEILKEIANTSAEIAGFYGFSADNIARAAFQTRRFGLSLQQAKNISEGLLNFEQSISSELELELLSGRQFNLERARSLALTGDLAGATEQVMMEMSKLTEQQRQNPILMRTFSQLTGLSADELNRAYLVQTNLNQSTKEYVRQLRGKGQLERAQIAEELGLQGLTQEQIEKNLSAQDKFNAALEKAKDQFSGLVDSGALDRFANLLIDFVNKASRIGIFRAIVSGPGTLSKTGDLAREALGSPEDFKKLLKDSPDRARYALQNVIKTSKDRGNLDQSAIDMLARQYGDDEVNKAQSLEVNDFTIRANPKDTLVMAGGTKFGEETNTLLKELISAVKEGKTINLDGRRVNEGLFLATSKFDRR